MPYQQPTVSDAGDDDDDEHVYYPEWPTLRGPEVQVSHSPPTQLAHPAHHTTQAATTVTAGATTEASMLRDLGEMVERAPVETPTMQAMRTLRRRQRLEDGERSNFPGVWDQGFVDALEEARMVWQDVTEEEKRATPEQERQRMEWYGELAVRVQEIQAMLAQSVQSAASGQRGGSAVGGGDVQITAYDEELDAPFEWDEEVIVPGEREDVAGMSRPWTLPFRTIPEATGALSVMGDTPMS